MQNIRKNRHSVYNLTYHIVLVTKYRHKCITAEILIDLIEIFRNTLTKMSCLLVEANGESNHVHLLVEMSPHNTPSAIVNSLKTVSSRLIRKGHKDYLKEFYSESYFWEPSYFIVTSGENSLEAIKHYIENQETPKA
ncbi:MAG: IS200/IS605 family transposase [Bacteroidia bacterium]